MSGYMMKLSVEVTDQTLPKLWPDSIMSEGSLMLLDFNKTYGGINTPVPQNGELVENMAWETARQVIGGGVKSDFSFPIQAPAAANNFFRAEFSAKKGLHLVNSLVNQVSGQDRYYKVGIPQKIIDYMWANKSHKYFVSVWTKDTRVPSAVGDISAMVLLFRNTSIALARKSDRDGGKLWPWSAPTNVLGERNQNLTGAIKLNNIAINGTTGDYASSMPTTETHNMLVHAGVGGIAAFGNTGNYINARPSYLHYRYYIEDLTVSGRTYAQVDALDLALWTEAFAAGGRLAADTFTNPDTFLP